MATYSIENGCVFLGNNLWEYRWDDVNGIHKIQFSSVLKPKIGDTLVDGVLVVRNTPKTNQDHSKWIAPVYDSWPTNTLFDTDKS